MTANSAPDVSVVMAAFNEDATIEESVRSILSQEGVEFEFIVVDDGSIDRTGAILGDLAASDRRIRVLSQENQGLTRSLIRGCGEARAPLIARQDAGDRSLPGRLTAQKAAFDACPDLAFASCWSRFVGPKGEFLYVEKGTGAAAEARDILDDSHPRGVVDWPTCHGSVMFRRDNYEQVAGYRMPFRFTQDWDLWYRLAEIGRFRMIPETLYEYRVSVEGLSASHRKRQNRLLEVARGLLARRRLGLSEVDVLDQVEQICRSSPAGVSNRARASANYFIGSMLRKNHDPRARMYFRESMRLNRLFVRAWIRYLSS